MKAPSWYHLTDCCLVWVLNVVLVVAWLGGSAGECNCSGSGSGSGSVGGGVGGRVNSLTGSMQC